MSFICITPPQYPTVINTKLKKVWLFKRKGQWRRRKLILIGQKADCWHFQANTLKLGESCNIKIDPGIIPVRNWKDSYSIFTGGSNTSKCEIQKHKHLFMNYNGGGGQSLRYFKGMWAHWILGRNKVKLSERLFCLFSRDELPNWIYTKHFLYLVQTRS